MFVRIDRNISSIWSFLFSCTTIPAALFALSLATATSAMTGRLVSLTTSSWPSILYLISCSMYSMANGMPMPITSAANSITLPLGLTLPPNIGSSIMVPLSAVAARDIEFSSRFCRSMRYRPDFTSCWRPICVSMRSCSGVLAILFWYRLYCFSMPCNLMSALRRAWSRAVRRLDCSSLRVLVSAITCGAISDADCSSLFLSSTDWLNCVMSAVDAGSSSPMLDGIISYLLLGLSMYSRR